MKVTKATKKLFAFLLAAIMMMAMSITAFAAITPQGNGTITVSNATIGETYAGYKIFDLTYSGDSVSYLIDEDNQFYSAVSGENSPFNLIATTVEGVYNVAIKEGSNNESIIAWLNSLNMESYVADLAAIEVQNADTVVSWNNVPYGYYLVTSTLGAVVTVDKNTPNVTIVDKNQEPGTQLEKTVGEDKVMQIGVPFTFTLTFTATNYDGETKIEKYTVSDTFPDGMDLVTRENNVTITIDSAPNEEGVDATLYQTVTLDNNRHFSFDIDWIDFVTGESLYTSPAKVTVTYQAVLNADAVVEGEGETNTAKLTWTGNPTGSEVPGEETVYTYALAIKKVNEDGESLAGAVFELYDSDGAKVKVSKVVDGAAGEYVIDPNGNASIISPDSGVIVIKGVDNSKYTLTETDAPDGYNLLEEDIDVTPVLVGTATTSKTFYLDDEGNVTGVAEGNTELTTVTADIPATAIAVVNVAGATLPSTGGMGTTVIYIIGAVLVIGAGIILVVRRRRNA